MFLTRCWRGVYKAGVVPVLAEHRHTNQKWSCHHFYFHFFLFVSTTTAACHSLSSVFSSFHLISYHPEKIPSSRRWCISNPAKIYASFGCWAGSTWERNCRNWTDTCVPGQSDSGRCASKLSSTLSSTQVHSSYFLRHICGLTSLLWI